MDNDIICFAQHPSCVPRLIKCYVKLTVRREYEKQSVMEDYYASGCQVVSGRQSGIDLVNESGNRVDIYELRLQSLVVSL